MLSHEEVTAFALKELPWIAKATGMDWKEGELPLFLPMTKKQLSEFAGGDGCYMAYSPLTDVIFYVEGRQAPNGIMDEKKERQWFKSALVHELVHYLQMHNGVGARKSEGIDDLLRVEREAYTTQANWLWSRLGVDPSEYKLGEEGIAQGCFMSALGAMITNDKAAKREKERA